MTGLRASSLLVRAELRLQLRDPAVLAFALAMPAVLLVLLAYAFPGFRDANPDLDGGRPVDLYTPIILVLTLVMIGISTISGVLASYRHDGILRRLRTTPVGATRVLLAQLAAQLGLAVVGVGLAVFAALVVLDVPGPESWFGVVLGLGCTAAATFAIGALLGALLPSVSAAQAAAGLAWLPVMVLAGLWFPRELMPEVLRRISDLSPGGAAVDAIQQAWFHGELMGGSLAVLVAWAVVTAAIGALAFRWG